MANETQTAKPRVINFRDLSKEEREGLLKQLSKSKMDHKHDHLNEELKDD